MTPATGEAPGDPSPARAESLAVVDQPTARSRALLAEVLGRLAPEQQSAAADALQAFAAAAREIPGYLLK